MRTVVALAVLAVTVSAVHAQTLTPPQQYAREVYKDMSAKVPELAGTPWVREARPLQLRFAGSRG